MTKLKAGAGKCAIRYTAEMLPTYGENYTSIHDLPSVQALVLESGGEKAALVAVNVVMLDDRSEIARHAAEILNVPEEKVIVHITHVLATPHFGRWNSAEQWMGRHPECGNVEEARRYMERENSIYQAHMDAVEAACRRAADSVRPAKLAIGTVYAEIKVNRVVHPDQGWWQGVNWGGETDRNVHVLRIDGEDGEGIAVLYNCNVAPGCMEFSETNGGRAVSGDLANASQRITEALLDSRAVAIYTTGATGDQWQALRARLDYITPGGTQVVTDLHEQGFVLMEVLATRLGEKVAQTASNLTPMDFDSKMALCSKRFAYEGQRVTGADFRRPAKKCVYEPADTVDAELSILTLGDIAIVCCGVELNVSSLRKIREGSPYKYTFLLEFAAGGGGYLPESDFYDKVTFQSLKSRYAKGTEELLVGDIISTLKEQHADSASHTN